MPDLSYLDLYEDDGQLLLSSGSLSADELIAQQELNGRPLLEDALLRPIRAFSITEHRSPRGAPMAEIVMLQSAALHVLRSLLRGREQGVPEPRRVSVYYTWSPRRPAPRQLLGRNFAENLDTWLRTAGAGEAFVEVPGVGPATIEEIVREMRTSLMQLQQSVGVEPEHADRTPPRRQAVPRDSAAERRRALAQAWLTAAEVSRQLGSTAENASHRANQLRRDGQLLGVWLPSEQAYRFPLWQLDANGAPVSPLAELLTLLRGPGGMGTQQRLTSGWGEVEWFLTPHALLDGASPAEILPDDPARVLAAAQEEFQEPADARW